MQDPRQDRPLDFGPYGKPARPASRLPEIAAAVVSLVWLVVVWFRASVLPEAAISSDPLVVLLAALLPPAVLWMAVVTLRSVRMLRQEAARLQATVESMRNAYLAQQQAAAAGLKVAPGRRPDEAALPARQAPMPVAAATDDQPGLALGTQSEDRRPPLAAADVVAALDFPDSDDDAVAVRALRLALEDRSTAKLIRAAQDVLTLLGQDGIYMDDLHPDPASPDVWRRFAEGARGRAVAGLGGVRDRKSLSRTSTRMREDPVFRDAAHHFLRQFDRSLQEFEKSATDADLASLAETRTARAFMLFGRVSGTFD